MRGWVASVDRVHAAAELIVETIAVERQSSVSVTRAQVVSVSLSTFSMREACGRRSHLLVFGSLRPGSSPLPSCTRERSTVSGW